MSQQAVPCIRKAFLSLYMFSSGHKIGPLFFYTNLLIDETQLYQYLDSTFDIFWVDGEFIFAQFRDVFEIWM